MSASERRRGTSAYIPEVSETGRLAELASSELVELVRGRAPEQRTAWELLVKRHVQVVWRVVRCFGLPQEAAWEAFQGTWLRAVEKLDTLEDPTRFAGWLATIARREALGVIRARARAIPVAETPEQGTTDAEPDDRLRRDELRRAVREGFGRLSPECQGLLRLLTADPPVDYREIGQILQRPVGSIGPTRARCLEKLRNTPALRDYLEGDR